MRISTWLGGAGLTAAAFTALLSMASPAMAAEWIGGHYGPYGHWIPGHWIGGPGGPPPEAVEAPPGYRPGRYWIAGHYDHGGWIPGHWR
jgi:hypothetical protein